MAIKFPNYKSYIITSNFGVRVHPVTKIKTQHNGIDMTATNDGKVGHPDYILAHSAGTVESVGYGLTAGNYVNIRVDEDTLMVYYHMSKKSTLKKGDKVKVGDKLGYMGNTGRATGKHLHFGIKYQGKWIDPKPYLDAEWVNPKKTELKKVSIELPILKRGVKSEYVKTMQTLLIAHGYKMLSTDGKIDYGVDGSFGGATERALKDFQKDKGLAVDGSCGKDTWTALMLVK